MVGRHRRPRSRLNSQIVAAAAVLASVILASTAGPAAAGDFPPRDGAYHNFVELEADIKAVEAAKPAIVDVFIFGKSNQNRNIWAAKISDNVAVPWEENEPEIMFDALHHAREHLTVEQAIYTLHLLADNYGSDSAITNLVNNRVIWIVFALNPDGGEYDLTCGGSHAPYCAWRKNRQSNGSGKPIGTDLNRNYDYRWGCCGGSSGNPASITYRGAGPFSATETRVLRDFVNGRVRNGIQQIRAHVTFHTNGRLILWPYGYTRTDIPADMSVEDHNTFVAMGKAMASLNGYKPEQSSDLYITDGDQIDWMYGVHRIFSFTWELYPPETPSVWADHYPADERIAPETARNRGPSCTSSTSVAVRIAPSPGRRRTVAPSATTSRSTAPGRPTRTGRTRPRMARGPGAIPERPRRAASQFSSGTPIPAPTPWSPAVRPGPARTSTTSTAGRRRSARSRSNCRPKSGH